MKDKLPMLDFFINGNGYSGTIGTREYRIVPEGVFKLYLWEGPFCYDFCVERGHEIEEYEFPLNNEGLAAMEEVLNQASLQDA